MLSPVQLERASLPTSSQHLLQRYARNASWNNPTWIPFCSSVILLQLTKLTNKSYQSPSQDVAGKIAAFASQSPRAVCVLSAMGSVSRAVLRHPADHPPSYNNPSIYEVGDHPICRGQIKEIVQLRPICNPPWCVHLFVGVVWNPEFIRLLQSEWGPAKSNRRDQRHALQPGEACHWRCPRWSIGSCQYCAGNSNLSDQPSVKIQTLNPLHLPKSEISYSIKVANSFGHCAGGTRDFCARRVQIKVQESRETADLWSRLAHRRWARRGVAQLRT